MDFERLTEKAQEAIAGAQRLAEERWHTQLDPEHLLQTLTAQEDGVVPAVLEKLGVSPRAVLRQLEPVLAGLPRAAGPSVRIYASPRLRRVWEAAEQEAARMKDDFISTEHLLLAMADPQEQGQAGQILRRAGVTQDRIYAALQEVRGGQRVTSATPEKTYQSLEKYGRELT